MSAPSFPATRLRRLRYNAKIRTLVRETKLDVSKLVAPLIIKYGKNIKNPIISMPGCFQFSVDRLEKELESLLAAGIKTLILFGIPATKDALGTDSYTPTGIIQTAIPHIKKIAPELLIISDLCFCEYTDHGHCGVVMPDHDDVDNDQTLPLLVKQAVSHAQAGADIVAPSGMIDGGVQAIRQGLDAAGFQCIPILSYAVKYASTLYGPFREAAEGLPKLGDRQTHQLDTANYQQALRECALDINEGADMLMVKPAHTYLDIIARVKQVYPQLPLCAYHTSGEYAMLKAVAEKSWVDEPAMVLEVLTSIQRAGADFIITYYAKEAANWL